MKKTISLFLVAFVVTVTALAVPVTVHTSCGPYITDTELWGELTIEQIYAELESICTQDQAGPAD